MLTYVCVILIDFQAYRDAFIQNISYIYVTNFVDRQAGRPKVWPYLFNDDVHRES